MLVKENAIREEIRFLPSGARYKVCIFECSNPNCKKEMPVQACKIEEHKGKCRRCCKLLRPFEHLYNELEHHVLKRGKVEFNLTFEQFLNIIKDKLCHYCERPLEFSEHSKLFNVHQKHAYQLDRMDNKKGYIYDNLVPCCWFCNSVKGNKLTYEQFMLLAPTLKEIRLQKEEYESLSEIAA